MTSDLLIAGLCSGAVIAETRISWMAAAAAEAAGGMQCPSGTCIGCWLTATSQTSRSSKVPERR